MRWFKAGLAVLIVGLLCGFSFAAEPVGKIDPETLFISQYVSSTVVQRPLSNFGYSAGIGYGSAWPTLANSYKTMQNGEMYLRGGVTAGARLGVYDVTDGEWDQVPFLNDAETISGVWTFSAANAHTGADTHTGLETHAKETFDLVYGRTAWRDDFDLPLIHYEEDLTAAVGTDAGMNCMFSRTPANPLTGVTGALPIATGAHYHNSVEGAQTYPEVHVLAGGWLDLDTDAGASEGMQYVFASDPQAAGSDGGFTAFTDGAVYFRIGFKVAVETDIAALHTGWRLNEDYIADFVLITQDTYAAMSFPAGTASATAATDTTDQTELEPTCDLTAGQEMHVEVRISAAGVPSYYCGATEAGLTLLTTPTAIGPFATGDVMVPYIAYIGTTSTVELLINYVEIGLVQ